MSGGNIETMVDQASRAFANGDDITALALFNQALDLSTGNESNLLVLHSNIGAVLMNMHQQDRAIQSFDRALEIDPHHVESQYNKGLVLLEQNKFAEALHLFNMVCLKRREFYLAQCSRCEALLNLNHFVEAREVAKLALALEEKEEDRQVITAQVLLGIAHYHLKDYSSANLAFAQVRDVHSLDALAKQMYALSLMGEGLATNNVSKMEMAIDIYPTEWENYHNLGVLLVQQNNAAQARTRFEQALDRNPESFYTLIALGAICLDVGEYQLACVYLKRACGLDSENATSRFNLGVALVKCNEVELAREEFSKLDKTDANALRALEMLNLHQTTTTTTENEALKHTESFVSLKSPVAEDSDEENQLEEEEETVVVVVQPAAVISAKPEQIIIPCDNNTDTASVAYVPYADLKFPKRPPSGVDPTKKETYLSPTEFAQVFGKTQEEFILLPSWKKTLMKKDAGLF